MKLKAVSDKENKEESVIAMLCLEALISQGHPTDRFGKFIYSEGF